MPAVAYFEPGILISGSGGFIGGHLTRELAASHAGRYATLDVSAREAVRALARQWPVHTLVHLAGKGTVLAPLAAIPGMLGAGPAGLVNLLEEFQPRHVVLASTCAMYGNAPRAGAAAGWTDVHPISAYGMAKAMSELLLRQYCSPGQATGLVLRFGNVVGPGGKGLIGLLVHHALAHPDGSVPLRMRGAGRVVRDYVPVQYCTTILRRSLSLELKPGSVETYNVGSGHPLTNRHVAGVVVEWLRRQGYTLNIVYDDKVGFGEAWFGALRTQRTSRRFRAVPPGLDEVHRAIVAAAEDAFLARPVETGAVVSA